MHAGISPATTVLEILPIRGALITKSMRARSEAKFLSLKMTAVQSEVAACGEGFAESLLKVFLAFYERARSASLVKSSQWQGLRVRWRWGAGTFCEKYH